MENSCNKVFSGLKPSSQSKKENKKGVYFQDTNEKINTCCFLKNPLPLIYYLFAGKSVDREEKEKCVEEKECAISVRSISQEKRRALVEEAEWKLQELKKLYKDSWSIYKLKSRQSVDNKSTTKLLRLLSKVRLKIMRTQGKIGLLEKCELLDMIENLDELNEEISTIKDDYYKSEGTKVMTETESAFTVPNSTMFNESLFMQPSQTLTYNLVDTSIMSEDWNSETTGPYRIALNNEEVTLTSNVSEEESCKTYIYNDDLVGPKNNLRDHSSLKDILAKGYIDKFESVSDDIVKIRNEIYKFVNGDLKRKRKRQMMMRKGNLSQIFCNEESQNFEHDQRVSSIRRTHSEYERQLHRLIKRLEEIKIAYVLLKNLPLKEGLKKYKRAEISRLMRALRLINKDAAMMKNKLDENERTAAGLFGDKSRRQDRAVESFIKQNISISVKDVLRPDQISVCSNGVGTSETTGDVMPWDRGTNNLYRTLMYNQIKYYTNLDKPVSFNCKYKEEALDKSVNCELMCSQMMNGDEKSLSQGDPIDNLLVKKINFNGPSKDSIKRSNYSLEIKAKNFETAKNIDGFNNQEEIKELCGLDEKDEEIEGIQIRNNFNKSEKKNAETSYDSLLMKPQTSLEGIPYWRSKFKELECDPFVKEAIESVVKGRNNAYSRAVMDMINKLGTKGMKFKIKCYNRGTSMTGISEGLQTKNVKCVVPETWYKYSNIDSKERALISEPKMTASIQTDEEGSISNKKGRSELYCFSKLSMRSFTLQNKGLRKSVSKRRPKHVQYPGLLCYRYKKRPRKLNKVKQGGFKMDKITPRIGSFVSKKRDKDATRHSTKTNFTTTTFVNSDKWLLNLLS